MMEVQKNRVSMCNSLHNRSDSPAVNRKPLPSKELSKSMSLLADQKQSQIIFPSTVITVSVSKINPVPSVGRADDGFNPR